MNKYLHVGCGMINQEHLQHIFPRSEWVEVRLDIDKNVKPDIIADMADLSQIEDSCFDAVYSSHNLEHLHNDQVSSVLTQFNRILKQKDVVIVIVPNLQAAAKEIANGNAEGMLYLSAVGPITALDIIYGFRPWTSQNSFMQHRIGFTSGTLAQKLFDAGFRQISVNIIEANFAIEGIGYKL